MNKELLKQALASIWALVYRATQQDLDLRQIDEIQASLAVISKGLEGDDYFNRRALFVRDCVLTSGILSIPYRKPKGTEEIMCDCDRLQRYLDSSH